MNIYDSIWFGRFQIFKPKKGAKIGIPYELWHHFAMIDNVVLLYVWDTREIIDCYELSKLKLDSSEMAKIDDNGQPLFIGRNSTKRAKETVSELIKKYPDLPILKPEESNDLSSLKKRVKSALESIKDNRFELIDDGKIIFVDKSVEIPESMLYMFTKMETFNPVKCKYADNNGYVGRAKYYAIIARCSIIKEWIENLKN